MMDAIEEGRGLNTRLLAVGRAARVWWRLSRNYSVVIGGLVSSDGVVRVDGEVGGVDVVASKRHLEELGVVDDALLHEGDDLVLVSDAVVDVVVELHQYLVGDLTALIEELDLVGVGEVEAVLSENVELADVRPGVEAVAHGVHGPDAHVLATSEQVHPVDLSVQALPVEGHGQPGERVDEVEGGEVGCPVEVEGVDEENVPRERHAQNLRAVGVLQVDRAVLDVVATPQQQFSLPVELDGGIGLVHLVRLLDDLRRSLLQLTLGRVDHLVQVVDVTEASALLLSQHGGRGLLSEEVAAGSK
mmetsp:Transcript_18165/g.31060  ORF Transcript_18165/g.31060 Transcript_18165/m.31060 type:complete len:302 (-) Transcript_18165:38-943(-)|eukprot:CAMPEP_0168613624 /NCGR_PEP_ID=MMETSP0449_2-20121227/3547_1 /TAXON_ID=1082188 /ORGANISM="Strombidium rassoulzadegani, Strain ras09" /LENGTH=301 /DNA_ID=CAMNT_0008654263 /DNA_START=52 /DNA_END=957 /DNA_ORIENTATION=-